MGDNILYVLVYKKKNTKLQKKKIKNFNSKRIFNRFTRNPNIIILETIIIKDNEATLFEKETI